ncbi:MAG TPA: helix-turn-helix transcriptional regulator [Ktedonobacteraceae bacterium]|nr:helix-turn-helix transcriptional regulator [Ktedonobacteraceae bacterium]
MDNSRIEHIHQGQIIAQYRENRHWTQQRLADELGVDLRTVQRMEQRPMIKNLKRRQFLVELLGIPAVLMALEDAKPRLNSISLLFNDDPMAYLENAMILRFEAQQIGGTRSASQGLPMWMREVTHFVKETQGTGWHTRALAVLSMSYLLQGTIARSMNLDYSSAHQSFQKAYRIAQEIDDPELQALALFRSGVTYINADQPDEAITSLKGALHTINGYGYSYLKGHTLKLLSEAYAKSQQAQECWRNVGLAENALLQLTLQRERSMFIQREFSVASVTAQKGVDAAFLHDYDRAINLINKGLAHVKPTFIPTRARLTIQKAEAYFGLGEVDFCLNHAEESLIMARSTGSNKTISRVKHLHSSLTQSKWKNERGVSRLGALLATQ